VHAAQHAASAANAFRRAEQGHRQDWYGGAGNSLGLPRDLASNGVGGSFNAPQPSALSSLGVHPGFVVVSQQRAYMVERFGRYTKTLDAGIHFLIPLIDRVAYVHDLRESAVPIGNQMAVTRDNVTLTIDGVLYYRIEDPYKASYGVLKPIFALTQLAQTTMRSELGKMSLDDTFESREKLNSNIVLTINEAAEGWGIKCMRYEIRDVLPPAGIRAAMEMQAEAERRKRAEILQSEGDKAREINVAEGERQSRILQAEGEASAILQSAEATAEGLKKIGLALKGPGGSDALAYRVAEQWVDAWGKIAKTGTTIVVPANPNDVGGMAASAMAIYGKLCGSVASTRPSAMNNEKTVNGLDVDDAGERSRDSDVDDDSSRNSKY